MTLSCVYVHKLAFQLRQQNVVVYIQSLDWNGGLEWWNGMVESQFSKNEAKKSHFLMHADINSDLMASLAYTEVKCLS